MVRKYLSISFFLILITFFAASVEQPATITIKNTVDMRNGPGSYYKLLLRLSPDTEVEQLDQKYQWLKIKTDQQTGWIPERASYLGEPESERSPDQGEVVSNSEDAFAELADDQSDSTDSNQASRAQVAAAVKGFAQTFTSQKTESQDVTLLENFNNYTDPESYQEFRNKRLQDWSWEKAQSRVTIKTSEAPVLNPKRERAGWGVANVIAQQGLIKDRALQQYLTNIALLIGENSHRFEAPVQVYILDTDKFTGYAAPNGAIFVSKAVLKLVETEAEFAFFVAHELAHIVHNHGMKETDRRQAKIRAQQRFQELDSEIDGGNKKYESTEQELNQMANEMYRYAIKDRLKQYEYSADFWGLAYVYRAGYDPHGGENLVQRIYNKQGDFQQKIGKATWKGTSLRKRFAKIKNQIDNYNLADNFGRSYPKVWERKMQGLGDE